MADYLRRSIEPLLAEFLAEIPATLINAPRASGKTTTGKRSYTLGERINAAPICTLWA